MERSVKVLGVLGLAALLGFLVLALAGCDATGPDSLVGSYEYEASTDSDHFEGRLHIDSIAEDGYYGWWEVGAFLEIRQRLSRNLNPLELVAVARDTTFTVTHRVQRDGSNLICEEATLFTGGVPYYADCTLSR